MERKMDELLAALKHQLLRMSALAEGMIADAIKQLVERDASVKERLDRHEHEVNKLQVEIDEACLNIIALRQPTASDLRFILGAAKTNADLERLADQAVNISEKAEHLLRLSTVQELEPIPRMAELAARMVKDALHAFVNRDPIKARDVLQRDDQIDELKRKSTESFVEIIRQDPDTLERCLDLILIARNIERIGDHATNIAENTIFVVEGRDVRHHLDENG